MLVDPGQNSAELAPMGPALPKLWRNPGHPATAAGRPAGPRLVAGHGQPPHRHTPGCKPSAEPARGVPALFPWLFGHAPSGPDNCRFARALLKLGPLGRPEHRGKFLGGVRPDSRWGVAASDAPSFFVHPLYGRNSTHARGCREKGSLLRRDDHGQTCADVGDDASTKRRNQLGRPCIFP